MQRTVALGERDVAVLEQGIGGTPLLLVHGFTGAKEDFSDHIDALADLGHHVVAPDLRGHGASFAPHEESHYTWDAMMGDLVDLVDALGWDSFVLLGHSFGGMLAQLLVLEHPERVRRLILMSTHHGSVPNLDPDLLALGQHVARTDGLGVIQEILKAGADPLANPAYHRLRAERDGYEAFCDAKFMACSASMYAALLPTFHYADDRIEQLSSIGCPTLVTVGELDASFYDAAHRMADVIADSVLDVFETAGHCPQFEAPEAWRASMIRFLGSSA